MGPRSLLLIEGREHLARRRLMLPTFHDERMRAYEAIRARRGGARRRALALREATMVSLIAYQGLRAPEELLALEVR